MATKSYLYTSAQQGYSQSLSELEPEQLLKVIVAGSGDEAIATIDSALPSTTTEANQYVAGSTGLASMGTLTPDTGTLVLGAGGDPKVWSALTISSTAGHVLTSNGTTATWAAPATAGTVTSVGIASTTGMVITNSPVTSSGTIDVNLPAKMYVGASNSTLLLGQSTYVAGTNEFLGDNVLVLAKNGTNILPNVTDGNNALIIGSYGPAVTTIGRNTVVGLNTINNLTTGSQNCLMGWTSGNGLIEGASNTLLGDSAGYQFEGSGNVMVGQGVGFNYTAYTDCVLIGKFGTDTSANASSNAIAIGSGAIAATNTAVIGNGSITGLGVGTAATYGLTLGSGTSGGVYMPRKASQTIAIDGGVFAVNNSDLPYFTNQNGAFNLVSSVTTNYGAAGSLLVGNATNYTPLTIGTANQVLTSNGTTAAWANLPIKARGQATILATDTSVDVALSTVTSTDIIIVSIAGYTGTADLTLGPIALTAIDTGVDFTISIGTAVPSASTVLVNYLVMSAS